MTDIARDMLSVAAEFAVASELCRRNVYAQPTFGNQKRTDLLIFGKEGKLLKVEVKGKQSRQWPNCKGIPNEGSILILVDFQHKTDTERPDFYILTVADWLAFLKKLIARYPDKQIYIDEDNAPIWPTQLNKAGHPYKGHGVTVADVAEHLETWEKVLSALTKGLKAGKGGK